MRFSKLMFGLAAVALVGCAGNQQAMERSMGQAESSKTLAEESKVPASLTETAAADLDSAKIFQENGEEEKAISAAEKSALEYKLSLLVQQRDELKKEDARIEKELRDDVERKLLYQNILDQELKGAK